MAAQAPDRIEEVLVKLAPQTTPAMHWVNANEMDVCLFRIGLRHETCQKPDNTATLLDGETGRAKVDKEDPWQQVRHFPPTPPLVDNSDDRVVIALFKMSDHGSTLRNLVIPHEPSCSEVAMQ